MESDGPGWIPTRRDARRPTLRPSMQNDWLTACACLVVALVAWALLQYFNIPSPLQGFVFFFVGMVVTFTMNLKTKSPTREDVDQLYMLGGYEVNLSLYKKLRGQRLGVKDDPLSVAKSLGLGNEFLDLAEGSNLQDPWTITSSKTMSEDQETNQ